MHSDNTNYTSVVETFRHQLTQQNGMAYPATPFTNYQCIPMYY